MTMESHRSTWFLPAERVASDLLAAQVTKATASPVVDALLRTWGGALAILNGQRQVVAINGAWLEAIGATGPSDALGLRPGETLRCLNAGEAPGGCGTSRACASCGAAAAILVATTGGAPAERDCSLVVKQGDEEHHYDLLVRAAPFEVGGEPLTLLTFRDVSTERRRASLERAFFHDLANLVSGLDSATRALPAQARPEDAEALDDVRALAGRLSREVQVQRALVSDRLAGLRVSARQVDLAEIVDLVERLFLHHPAATGKTLQVAMGDPSPSIQTDPDLLQRVLGHLILNAFEATSPGGTVRLAVEPDGDGVALRVWNAAAIPAAVAPRIFQRFFSTKPGEGRGQGTYIAKAFTERLLRGTVGVTSSPEGGTAFEVRLPPGLAR